METAGFVPEPSCGRGTLGVIWACLPTIMFVIYTAIHLDAHRSMGRAMWGIFIFFVPESMPASAINQYIKARRLQKRLRALQGWDSWTLKQSFLVVKKGVRRIGNGEVLTPQRLAELAEQQQYMEEKKHVAHGSNVIRIDMLPNGAAINRRSKKSWFEKILAGLQAMWFCINIVSRLADGYLVTPLEVMTIAYTCCGLIASVAWLRCPQDIEDQFEIDLDTADDEETIAALECGYSTGRNSTSTSTNTTRPSCLVAGSDRLMMGIVCVVLILLAAMHIAEWDYPFPSVAEAWIWRSCSVATLPIGLLILFYGDRCRSKHWSLWWTAPVYVVVRLALLTVAATSFRQVPLSVFDTPDWSDYWGHIGK